ncbi:MAG: hypothetical protein P1V35_17190 [Planctomycetota bacterium]|nr:hypothetical protein [Planctomycetota bacterium]
MNRYSKPSTWKQTLAQAGAVVVLYLLGLMAWNTLMVPNMDGLRLGEPILSPPVEQWRPGQHGIIYRFGETHPDGLVGVGSSRAQRAIRIAEMEGEGVGPVWVLSRPAALTLDLLSLVDENLPGRCVIALSPLGLGNEQAQPMMEPPAQKPFNRRFDAWSSDWADMYRRRVAEPMLPPAWRYGWFGGFGQEKYFDAIRYSLRPETREARFAVLEEVQAFITALKAKGWNITCIRFPTYGPMRDIEDETFDGNLFTVMCDEVGVPYIDYGSGDYTTSDGSHLGVEGATQFSRKLAQDLLALPGMGPVQ